MLDHLFTGIRQIITFCLMLGVGIFAARIFLPELWSHAAQAEASLSAVKAQGSALAADEDAAGRAQAACLSAASGGVRAGRAIDRISQPVKQAGKDQPMITAKDLADVIQ